jgi:hypothetical protein
MSFLSFWFWVKNEKPAIDWQSRVSENRSYLEFQSHDAQKTGVAQPVGHAANDRRVLQHLGCERGLHLLPAIRNTIPAHLSKFFRRLKNALWAGGLVLD